MIFWYYLVIREAAMSKNTSITLGNHFAGFVERQVAEGRYGSTSEVVRAGLRLLEEHEAKLAALRAALVHGEESGPAAPFDFEAFVDGKRKAGSE
jgi:antitoxin ParD1/3/4